MESYDGVISIVPRKDNAMLLNNLVAMNASQTREYRGES